MDLVLQFQSMVYLPTFTSEISTDPKSHQQVSKSQYKHSYFCHMAPKMVVPRCLFRAFPWFWTVPNAWRFGLHRSPGRLVQVSGRRQLQALPVHPLGDQDRAGGQVQDLGKKATKPGKFEVFYQFMKQQKHTKKWMMDKNGEFSTNNSETSDILP